MGWALLLSGNQEKLNHFLEAAESDQENIQNSTDLRGHIASIRAYRETGKTWMLFLPHWIDYQPDMPGQCKSSGMNHDVIARIKYPKIWMCMEPTNDIHIWI